MATFRTRGLAVAAVLALGVTSVAACGKSGSGGGSASDAKSSKGGTLTVLANEDFAHLDPARNWTMRNQLFGVRLLYRTLTTYAAEPGAKGGQVVPDLAGGLGTPSNGNKTWTYHLRPGLKYEDGSPITAQDVKYGVERTFSPELPEGASYLRTMLAGGDKYTGPYKDTAGKGLDSIQTPDPLTISFTLTKPSADFDYVLALPTSAPVPKAQDSGVKYDGRVFSSGPYKIQTYDRGKQLVLVRNTYWDPKTDQVRKAYPDKIVVQQGLSSATIEQRLIADQGPDQTAVTWSDVSAASMPRILTNPQVKSRFTAEPSVCTRILYFNMSKAPFNDLKVRQAVAYGLNREAYRTAHGGDAVSDIATSYMPPAMTGGQQNTAFQSPPEGDVAKAKQFLAQAGKTSLNITLTGTTSDSGKAESEAIQQSLARIGVTVTINSVDKSAFYDTIGDPKKEDDMVLAGWCADWPSGASFIPPIFDGRTITPKGNQVYSQLNDPAVNSKIDQILAMTDAKAAQAAWGQLDTQIVGLMPGIPMVWDRMPLLRGAKVTGAYGHQIWEGEYDYATLGVK